MVNPSCPKTSADPMLGIHNGACGYACLIIAVTACHTAISMICHRKNVKPCKMWSWIENELIELINSNQFRLSIPIQFQFKIFQFNSNSIHAELNWIDYQFQFNSWIDPSPACNIRKLTAAFVSKIGVFSQVLWTLDFSAKMAEFSLPVLQIWRSRKRVAIQIQLMNIHVSECKYYCLHLVPKFGDVRNRQNWRLHPTVKLELVLGSCTGIALLQPDIFTADSYFIVHNFVHTGYRSAWCPAAFVLMSATWGFYEACSLYTGGLPMS